MEDRRSLHKKVRVFPRSPTNSNHEVSTLRRCDESDKALHNNKFVVQSTKIPDIDTRIDQMITNIKKREYSEVIYNKIIDDIKHSAESSKNSSPVSPNNNSFRHTNVLGEEKLLHPTLPIGNETNQIGEKDNGQNSPLSLLSLGKDILERHESRSMISQKIAAKILDESKKAEQLLMTDRAHDRYPCPAKKMGPSHNRTTAYLKILPNTPHGMPLLCSHALCRKGRLKFVFCQYCNQPVSRMKFEQRHAHPEHLLLALSDSSRHANPRLDDR
jgi:hypothetical protein